LKLYLDSIRTNFFKSIHRREK